MDRAQRMLTKVLVAAMTAVGPVDAENMVENGELDLDVVGWLHAPSDSDLDWHTLDHDSCGVDSGSALAHNESSSAAAVVAFESCVLGIVGGAEYSLAGYLRIPSGQGRSGAMWLTVLWRDEVDSCGGVLIGNQPTSELQSSNPDVWIRKALPHLVAPLGAGNATVRVSILKDQAGGTLQGHFDGIHLVAGNGYLFGDGFESDTLCRWSEVVP